MASTESQTQSVEQIANVQLKYMVDKVNNRVLWAEAEKDFVDVLFSFLTLPLGTIARLVSQTSNSEPVKIGSLSSLYQSVADLKEERFWTKACKEMLLCPRNSMEAYCNKLKLNIDDTPVQYFSCDNCCGYFSPYKNTKCCYCGKVTHKEGYPSCVTVENGFVRETASFIICDDLRVVPYAFATSLDLLQKLGVYAVEELMIDMNKKKVIDLLKLSLLSKTPLTDLILKKNNFGDYSNAKNQIDFATRKEFHNRKLSIKVTIRKSTEEILFAEGEEDFADFILSFLTFPLGGVLHMLESSSSLCCLDNLYKSLIELSPLRFFLSRDLKDTLVNPMCFPYFNLNNQILPIRVSSLSRLSSLSHGVWLLDPKLSTSKSSNLGEFVKGPSVYMVTDDLVVTPMTSTGSALSYLDKFEVSISDLEQRVIQIGVLEGLCLLKASLISTSSLTNALKQFISPVKEEK